MRPSAYRRNACGLCDRQAIERIRLQAGALFAAAAPKPTSPARTLARIATVIEQVTGSRRWNGSTTRRHRRHSGAL